MVEIVMISLKIILNKLKEMLATQNIDADMLMSALEINKGQSKVYERFYAEIKDLLPARDFMNWMPGKVTPDKSFEEFNEATDGCLQKFLEQNHFEIINAELLNRNNFVVKGIIDLLSNALNAAQLVNGISNEVRKTAFDKAEIALGTPDKLQVQTAIEMKVKKAIAGGLREKSNESITVAVRKAEFCMEQFKQLCSELEKMFSVGEEGTRKNLTTFYGDKINRYFNDTSKLKDLFQNILKIENSKTDMLHILLKTLEVFFESDPVYKLSFSEELIERLGSADTEKRAQEFIGQELIKKLDERVSYYSKHVFQTRIFEASSDVIDMFVDAYKTIREGMDSDGDGLPDVWETGGVDTNGDGEIDLPLNLMGADPNKRDIFIEIDWMVKPAAFPGGPEVSLRPSDAVLRMLYEEFKKYDIILHLDAGPDSIMNFETGEKWGDLSGGNEIPYSENLNLGSGYSDWKTLVSANFESNRESVFRHCLFVNKYNSGGSSGIANGIPGQYFIVSLGSWSGVTDQMVAGTFMHELGHTLGLCHGGCDHDNYKPNYLSIMNYSFQLRGLQGTSEITYSNYLLPSLYQSKIVESDGIDPNGLTSGTGLGTSWRYKNKEYSANNIASQGIDFNRDGTISDKAKKMSLVKGNDEIKSYRDWDMDNITFAGGSVGALGAALSGFEADDSADDELTYEEAIENGLLGYQGDGSIYFEGPSVIVANRQGQKVFVKIYNLSNTDVDFQFSATSKLFDSDFQQDIHVQASINALESALVSIPLTDNPKKGEYTIDMQLLYDGNVVNEIASNVSVYDASSSEIASVFPPNYEDDTNIPEHIKEQYDTALNNSSPGDGGNWWKILLGIVGGLVVIGGAVFVFIKLKSGSGGSRKKKSSYEDEFKW